VVIDRPVRERPAAGGIESDQGSCRHDGAIIVEVAAGDRGAQKHGKNAQKWRDPRQSRYQSLQIPAFQAGQPGDRRVRHGVGCQPVNPKTNRMMGVVVDRLDLRIMCQAAIDAMNVKDAIRIAESPLPFVACDRQSRQKSEDAQTQEQETTKRR